MTSTPKITTTHDWIRVALGNNRSLTFSHNGAKTLGAVPKDVVRLWFDLRDFKPEALTKIGCKEATMGAIVKAFADNIGKIWPEWNLAPRMPKIGETVSLDFGKRAGRDEGVVEAIKGTKLVVRFKNHGLVRFPADMLS